MYFPSSTYRIQLNSNYTLSQLKNIIGYLNKLGISTIYAAPITTAMKGSTHGYDVCDPDVLNNEIGTEKELEEIAEQLNEYGMGWLQDIVPNHMAFLTNNKRLTDVLERGEKSPYYNYFDINWKHPDPVYNGKVMVPFLGKDADEAIDAGEIKLVYADNGLQLACFDEHYPVAVYSYAFVFSLLDNEELDDFADTLFIEEEAALEQWNAHKIEWLQKLEAYKETVQQAVDKVNADKGLLRKLLSRQHYVFTWYMITKSKINFRRFFTVNQLICLRMEDEFVFDDYHKFVHGLYEKGLLQGVRIDHIDGLYAPQKYVQQLRELFGKDCYIIAEKILEYNEDIARDWDLQGTSGYEFLSFANQLLTNKTGSEKLLSFYKELVPGTKPYDQLVFEKKLSFLQEQMGGELENLLELIKELQLNENEVISEDELRKTLSVLMACFPVYRIYPTEYPLDKTAVPLVNKAFERAEAHVENETAALIFFKKIFFADGTNADDDKRLLFLKRLMQFTGPLAAKGVEDTTFFVYNPLISHNEVGEAPSALGVTVNDFHAKMQSRLLNNPNSLNASSTHDTKRGEDGRMRINALAEMPGEWIQAVNNWRQANTPYITLVDSKPAPSTNDEYFIYQSLIGSFPEDLQVTQEYIDRSLAFIEKALREAKVETTYDEPNAGYEKACKDFIVSVLNKEHNFLQSFVPFLEKIIAIASVYSLAQVIVKSTAPGIPDVYQGCEFWDLSYVDPDNRRPVNYEYRVNALNEIEAAEKQSADAALQLVQKHQKEGWEKLFVTYKILNYRNANNELFLHGKYLPITGNDNVVAYARKLDDKWALVILPINIKSINDAAGTLLGNIAWSDFTLTLPTGAPPKWTNIFTGESTESSGDLALKNVFAKFAVAVLVSA